MLLVILILYYTMCLFGNIIDWYVNMYVFVFDKKIEESRAKNSTNEQKINCELIHRTGLLVATGVNLLISITALFGAVLFTRYSLLSVHLLILLLNMKHII